MSAHNNESWSTAPIVPVLTEKATDVPADCDLGSLRQAIGSLRQRQQQDFEAFRTEMAAEIASLEAATAAAIRNHAPVTPIDQPDTSAHPTSRRTLLKWGGVGAAAALAVAGGTALRMPTVHAADGFTLKLGNSTNTAEDLTQLTYDGSETKPTAFKVSIGDNGLAINGNAGNYNTAGSAGIYGQAGGGANAFGVAGTARSNGTGVYGVATGNGAWGVWGSTSAGIGVLGASGTGIDLVASGSGRLASIPQVDVGAPTTGAYVAGEQIRDAGGTLFICVASGSPGTWLKVATGAAGRGGMVKLLSAPIRLLDTRLLSGMLPAGAVLVLQVTGVDVGGISVPKGATGVVGNVTVVQPTGAGDLRLYPGGAPLPATSSINFASGQVVANGVTVGLNTSGQISIKVDMPAGTSTHVIFDASGYVM